MADYRITVDTDIDTSKLDAFEKKIKSLENESLKIKIDVDADNISKQVTSQINKALGTGSSKKTTLNLDINSNKIKTDANNVFKDIQNKASKVSLQISSGKEYRDNISEINKTIKEINRLSINPDVNLEQLKEAERYLDKLVNRKNRADIDEIDIFDGLDTTAARNFAVELEKVEHAINNIQAHARDLDISKQIKQGASETKAAMNELASAYKRMDSLQKQQVGLDVNSNQYKAIDSEINRLIQKAAELQTKLGNNIPDSFFDSIAESGARARADLDKTIAKVEDARRKMADARLDNVQANFHSINADANNAVAKIEKFGNNANQELLQLKKDVVDLQTALKVAIDTGDVSKAADVYDELSDRIKQATSAASNMKSEMNLKNINSELDTMRQKAKATIELWRQQNSASEKMFGKDMDGYLSKLDMASTKDEIRSVSTEFGIMQKQAKIAGVAQMTIFDRLTTKAKEYASYIGVAGLAMNGYQLFRSMAQNVLEVDTAMTGLYRVTDLTQAQYTQLYSNMISSAQKYGATLTDIINATSDWTRAGFDADTSNKLAEVTTMYQHIADLDYNTASENLLTAYNGFKDSLSGQFGGDVVDTVRYITDVFNELDNKYSVTAAGLGEALQRSASAMQLAGNTFQETAAMTTGMTEVIQDPEKSGQALKILSLRLRGMKGELQEMGEEVDPTVENISKMQGQILNLTHGKVDIFDDGEFKSTYEIMDGIHSAWKDMSDIEQADLLETIAGKNRANEIAALISNWENVKSAVLDAENATGSASRENDKYMEHMQSALDRFTAAWQSLSATALDSGFLTGLINFGTDAITVIDDLVDRFGVLQPLLAGIFGGAGLLGKGLFKTSDNELSFLNTSLSDLKDAFSTGWNRGKSKNGAVGFLSGASEAFSEFNKSLGKIDRKALDNVRNILSKGEGNFSTSELVAAFDGTSDALSGLRDKAKEGKLSLDDLGNASVKTKTSMLATKAAALALNVGIGLLASVAIDAAIKGFDSFVHAAENASEAADLAFDDASATATQAEESYRSLTDLVAQYKTLAAQDTTDPTVRLQIADVQSQINDLIGDEASGIDLVNGNLSQQLSLLNQIQASQASKTLESAKNAYNAAVEASEKAIGEDSFLRIKGWGLTESWDEDAEEFFNSVDEAYKKGAKNVSRSSILGNTLFVGAEYDNEMNKLETAAEKAEYLQGMVDNVTAKLGKNAESNKIVQGLKQQIEAFNQYTDDISSSARTVMETLAEEFSAKNVLSEFTDIGAEQFEAARNKMLSYIKNDTSISEALKSGALDSSDISSYVNTYLSTLDNFSNGYYEWASDIQSVQDMMDVNGIGSLDGLGLDDAEIAKLDDSIEKMHQLKEAYSDFQAGKLDTSDIDKLKKDFPELATIMDDAGLSSDDFGLAIQTLLSDMNADAVATFNGAIGDVTKMSDEAKSSVTILGNAIQNLGVVSDAMSFDIDLEEETNTLSKLNEAMAASKTATGLTAEQIESINVAFGSLDGYNAAAMFEETANGIRLNTQEYNKFSKALADGKLKEADDVLETLSNQYKILTSQINAARKAGDIDLATKLMSDRDDIVAQTNAIAEQAAQYKGLTSAYKQWQDAQSSGNDRDMYESIGSAFEEVQDEIKRGWWDDSTREYLELMTGRDLSTANIDQMKDAYAQLDKQIGDTGYTIKSFFTQTEEGTFDTNGIYNFLEAAESFEDQLGKDFVKRNEDGNIIGFEIDVEGRKALAEAMGISEELIDIIIRASEDAGFVVNMDGTYTQLADMKVAAEQAATSLKEIGKTQMDFTFDTSDTEQFTAELEEAKKLWESYRNEDGSINFEAEGAQEAVELYSTLIAMADQLSEPTYMQLDASQVDAEIQKPLQMMQDYERLLEKKHQIEIGGGDLTDVNAEMDDIVEKLNGLDKETKVKLGIEGMSKEEIQAGLEAGTIEVPATVDLQIEMSDNIQDIRMALLKLTGAITDEEYDAYIKMRLEPEVDEGDTQQKVQESLSSALSGPYSSDVGVSVPVDPEPTKSLQQAFGEENQTAEVDVTPKIDSGALNEEINDIRATDVPVNLKPAQPLQEALGDNRGLIVDVEPHVTKDVNDILDISPQEVAVEFIANTVDVDSYTPEEKQAIAKYLVDGGDVESYESPNKEAIVRFLKESGDVDNYTPAQRQAIAKYILDSSQPDGYQPSDKQATAKFNKDSSEPDGYQPPSKSATVTFNPNTSKLPTSFPPITRTVNYVVKTVGNFFSGLFGAHGVNGTAHAIGTAHARGASGRAFKQGDWSTKKDEIALTGELGPELVVPPNDNRWYTVGDNGAEFAKIPRGSIVFNHRQTEELFKNGRVTSGGGRGRSLANGTAFSTGSGGAGRPSSGGKPVGGGTTIINNNTTNNYYNGSKSSSKSNSSKSTKSSSSKSSSIKEAEEFEETLDWIEIAIDRIERAIDSLDRTASSAFKSWGERTNALNQQMQKVTDEIALQQQAYDRYMQQANSVGLSEDWASKVRDGTIDISVITDENLADQIKTFQEW